jgi:quercetin dioxygenase-like cupin family protein
MNRILIAVMCVVALSLAAATAIATPGSGILEAPIVARGSFPDDIGIKFMLKGTGGTQIVNAKDPSQVAVQRVVIGPGGQTGWHTHSGPAVVVIAEGTLTLYQGDDPTCTGHPYRSGEAFVDSGRGNVHIGRNLSETENVLLYVSYFEVPPGGSPRIDAPDPGNCSF